MNLLAFDLGASGGKLFLAVIRDGEVSIRDIHRFDNISYSMGNGLYWDILNIYREMNRGIKKAIELTSDQIDAFAIDSFSNDFGLIDRDGVLLSPCPLLPGCPHPAPCRQDLQYYFQRAAVRLKRQPERSVQHLYAACRHAGRRSRFSAGPRRQAVVYPGSSALLPYRKDHHRIYAGICQPDVRFPQGRLVPGDPGLLSHSPPALWHADPARHAAGTHQRILQPADGDEGIPGGCSLRTRHRLRLSLLPPHLRLRSDQLRNWALIGTELPSCVITDEGYQANLANEGGYPGHHRLLRNVMSSWFIQETRRYYQEHGEDYSFSELGDLAMEAEPFRFFFDPDDPRFYDPGDIPGKILGLLPGTFRRLPGDRGGFRCAAFMRAWL